MSKKLSGCPFCGSDQVSMNGGSYYAVCGNCGAEGPWKNYNDASAIAAWNRRASPAPALPACKWQPIETAPKDGKVVLLWLRSPWSEPRIAWWYESWRNWQPQGAYPHPTEDDMSGIGSQVPTHWMPLPADPTTDSLKAEPAISESYMPDAARNEGAA